MPSAVPYTPRNFVPDRFEPRGRLADFARQAGRDQADAIRRSGDISAQMWSGLGQNIGGTLREIAAYPAQQRQAQMIAQKQQREEQAYQEAQQAKRSDAEKTVRFKQLFEEYGLDIPEQVLVADFGEEGLVIKAELDKRKPKVPEPFTLNPGDVRFDGTGKQIANVPKPEPVEKPKTYQVTVPGPNGQPITRTATEEEMAKGVPTYRAPVQGPAPERPSVWVTKGGDQRYVTPTEAGRLSGEGWRSGQGREQGRPVTSGDAGRIAEFDTSLNDLNVLTNTVTGSTGTSAKVGSMLPNWVTELTGRGISAKQKQASIDRVKQVIGKALEGGVLRKEDELKYEKILPTIYDAPAVVTSKLQGLQQALTLRRQTTLDALTDAGYDTSKFETRAQVNDQKITGVPDLAGVKPGMGRRFTDGPFKGQTWSIGPDGKPFKVGG